MFKIVRQIIFIVLILQSGISIQAQSELMSLITDENCDSPCWLGIIPGVTTEAQIEAILDSHNINYEKNPLGAEGSTSYFYYITEYARPFLRDNSALIYTDAGIVTSIEFPLQNVEINELIAELGNPTHILQDGTSYRLVYESENIAIGVIRSDQNHVFNLWIMSDEVFSIAYQDYPAWDEVETCNDSNQLCDVVNVFLSSPTNDHITFVGESADGFDIFTVHSDDNNLIQLTDNHVSFDPVWSPDGVDIAYISLVNGYQTRLFISNADGTNQQEIVSSINVSDPDWSPDGDRLAFVSSNDSGGKDIYIVNADGTNLMPVTESSTDFYTNPIWLNDSELLVLADRSGEIVSADLGPNQSLYRINLNDDESEELRLVGSQTSNLAISPDGNRVIFDYGANFSRLEMYTLDTGTSTTLFEWFNDEGIYASNASWSPDGEEIVFLYQDNPSTSLRLAIYTIATQEIRFVDNVNPLDKGLSWQPQ